MTLEGLTSEDVFRLQELGEKAQSTSSWTDEQMADCYTLVNFLYQTNEYDQHCGGCRRERVNLLRQAYLELFPKIL